MTEGTRDADEQTPSRTGPVGTVVGATLGPLAAAVGTVVDESRLALSVSVGTGTSSDAGDDDLEDAATIEIGDTDESTGE